MQDVRTDRTECIKRRRKWRQKKETVRSAGRGRRICKPIENKIKS